eukprot:2376910-Pyramimonas_sp.AAC.1
MSFRLRSFPTGASMDPYVIYHGNVIYQWCRAVWDGSPGLHVIQKVFEKASDDLWRSRRPWHVCTSPAHVYLLTAAEL